MDRDGVIVGIDLGTTNSLVAVCDAAGPRVIPDDRGRRLLPSVVRLEPAGADLIVTVGHEAKDAAADHASGTFASIKRLMGRSAADAAPDAPYLAYPVLNGERDSARVRIPGDPGSSPHAGRLVSPEEVSAYILRTLRDRVSSALGRAVTRAVITVPAYFDDAQRQATRTAGRLAGFDHVRILNEPTAAALAYGFAGRTRGPSPAGTIAVYDLGGGTFDISVLRLTPGDDADRTDAFRVLATAGDTHLGGDDVDHLLAADAAGAWGVDLSAGGASPRFRRELLTSCERAKCSLTEADLASIRVRADDGRVLERTWTRDDLGRLATPWVERTLASCSRALADARRKPGTGPIDAVILVGGATRMPLVRRRVAEYFGLPPYTAVDPDEAVALGAAVQGALLSGAAAGALLLDVIPLSLGIETVGGAVAKLIVRNSTVPARAVERFSTSVDGQTSISIRVYQGEREMAADCRLLAEFRLRGLPPMPAGVPQVEVEFLADAGGVLHVSASERRTGKRASLQVIPNHGLTPEDVARVEREAFAHARDDMTRHRVVDLVANSRLDLKWIGDRFERFKDRLAEDQRRRVAEALAEVSGFIARAEADWRSVDPDAFHRAKESLDAASVPVQELGIAESLRGG